MTNRPSWRQAARELEGFAGRADLGLHLNLTTGAPLTAMPGFAPAGNFPPLNAALRAACLGGLPRAEIAAEIAAQIDAFENALGRPPDFIDGHQHVHVLPGIRRMLLDRLARRAPAHGPLWLRDSSDTAGRILARRREAAKALSLAFFAQGFRAAARTAGFDVNEGFSGFSSFDPQQDYGEDFASYLRAPGPRHLIMCHPGHVDAELAACDSVTTTREQELAFLLSSQFTDMLAARGAVLTRWNGTDLATA
jgi:predicted glycoside hydrolase/deacetylase ChbG (UPF0249 family)